MQRARILVADDDTPTRALLCEAFQRAGHEVHYASSGPEIHELLDSKEFDVLVIDIIMPGMDAYELIRSVRRRAADTVLVLTTGYPSIDTTLEAIRSKVWDYVTKPFDIEALVASVETGLRQRQLQRENQRLLVELQAANRKLAEQKGMLEGRLRHATASFQASNEALRNRVAQLARLNELANALNQSKQEKVAVRQIADAVLDLLPADFCGILLPDAGGGPPFSLIYGARAVTDAVLKRLGEIMWDAFEVVAGPVMEKHDLPPILAGVRDDASPPLQSLAATMSVQMAVHGEVLGILSAGTARPGVLTEADRRILSTIASQAAAGLESTRAYAWVQNNYLATIQSLAKSLEAKDTYTSGHSMRVAETAVQIAEAMGLDAEQVAMIRYAATLHDIGKIGVEDSTIRSPKRLSAEELESVRRHPELGEEILRPVQMLRPALPLIRHHHERWDGTGYPDGLAGEEIPLGARIIAVADAFDAMTSTRPYRERLSTAEALRELYVNRGKQFDPEVVYAFLELQPEEATRSLSTVKPTPQANLHRRTNVQGVLEPITDSQQAKPSVVANSSTSPAKAESCDRPVAQWLMPLWAAASLAGALVLLMTSVESSWVLPTSAETIVFAALVMLTGVLCALSARGVRLPGVRWCAEQLRKIADSSCSHIQGARSAASRLTRPRSVG